MKIKSTLCAAILVSALAAASSMASAAPGKATGENKDYRTFYSDGRVDYGRIGDSYSADLVLYLAGNQFMVMQELIGDFLKKNSGVRSVYVETIPPGQIFNQIVKGGKINGQKTAQNPDVYARYGFVNASKSELKLRAIPGRK